MYCHSCGTQVGNGIQFCPACGASLIGGVAAPQIPFIAPVGVRAQSGRWIGEGWEIVKSDFWMFGLLGLVFCLLNIWVLQGALQIGMHIYVAKKMAGRPTEFG